MISKLRRMGLYGLAGWAMLGSSAMAARNDDRAAALYGRGVQAYFSGRTAKAESLLSQALAINGQDPRIYYFRGLSRLRSGREADARRDLAAGAVREAARPNRYAVGVALQRVQGSERLLLERFRRDARTKTAGLSDERARRHGEQMAARDAGATREQIVIPLDELLRPGGPRSLPAGELARESAAAHGRPGAAVAPQVSSPAESGPETESPAAETANPFEDDTASDSAEPARPASPPVEATDAVEATDESSAAEENADENPFDF
jgi:hypothetical protein